MSRKLICYELNEVPWQVVDRHVASHPDGPLARLLRRSDHFTTHTVDDGELHPWSTWPTLHRGVANTRHGIRFLNQDLSDAREWPPIWDLLNGAGVSTGVCGSLQSYPPSHDPAMQFHIPDTFAAGKETVPKRYEAFQALNLRQTNNNKATVSRRFSAAEIREGVGVLRIGVRAATLARIVRQLVAERRNSIHTCRRALLQPELAFDVLLDCLSRKQPQFVTFFSNHVAGMMHRYWKYSFPEDFGYTLRDDAADRFHAEAVTVAMRQFETHLERLAPICKRHGYDLIVCSSMGQEAIERGDYVPEVKLVDLDKLLRHLPGKHEPAMNLAMHPDIAFEFESGESLAAFRDVLGSVRDSTGKRLFTERYAPVKTTLNVQTPPNATLADDGVVKIGDDTFTVESLGLQIFERDIGTGYHQPEGLLVWGPAGGAGESDAGKPFDQQRRQIDTRSIAPTLLEFFGVAPREYMLPTFRGAPAGASAPRACTASSQEVFT